MLKPEENERLTRVGAGTPMGRLLRRYWLPAALSEELPEPDGAPVRVRMLGEDLIAFRDSEGKVGLLEAYCPHRRAPLFFGRNENCGLRCVYHGWKFDRTGACVDMPSEPPESNFKDKVTITAYPVWEGAGMVWAYMGPPELMPAPPDYELVRAPASHRCVSKTIEHCNWLQALEGGLDTSHSSFLHNNRLGDHGALRSADTAPRLEVERTDYGYTYAGIRKAGSRHYVRAYHYVMPAQQMRGRVSAWRGGGLEEIPTLNGHIWVPLDDYTTAVYNWMYAYNPEIPLSREFVLATEQQFGRAPEDLIPGTFELKRNLANNFMIDRQAQKTRTFTGIEGINTQDFAVQEGMGPIVDRSKEHLGSSDRAIAVMRQLLLEAVAAVERGEAPRGVDPVTYRDVRPVDLVVELTGPWREVLKEEMRAKF
ncbi:MAG TPA: Rieske 2Fe-2S domain-containing protein [Candidatus Binataceae bacterium]|nr:Rieske 2Fe-2S domain-containing protein [Candidatus Binataceae bacterium]